MYDIRQVPNIRKLVISERQFLKMNQPVKALGYIKDIVIAQVQVLKVARIVSKVVNIIDVVIIRFQFPNIYQSFHPHQRSKVIITDIQRTKLRKRGEDISQACKFEFVEIKRVWGGVRVC